MNVLLASTSSKWSITARSPRCKVSPRGKPGQIVAVLGTNGAGKTTTLRAISGFSALTMRASPRAATFKASRSRTGRRTEIARAASCSCPSATRYSPISPSPRI